MKISHFITLVLSILSINIFAQKKVLDHKDVALWSTINHQTISNNGKFIFYDLKTDEKDSEAIIKTKKGKTIFNHKPAIAGKISYESKYAFFTIKPYTDSIKALKRKKVKKKDLPKDSLGIFYLNTGKLVKLPNLKSYAIPEKWDNYLAYYLQEIKTTKKQKDSTRKKSKKVGKDNGYHLVLYNLVTEQKDTFKYVTNHAFSKTGHYFAYTTTGKDSTEYASVYVYDTKNKKRQPIYNAKKAKFYQLKFSDSGQQLGFVVDADTTKKQIRPYKLYTWMQGENDAVLRLKQSTAPSNLHISPHRNLQFSEDDSKLYFGLAPKPIIKDTTLLEEEIVNVEVWTYDEPRLYTVQELQAKNDAKKSYLSVLDLKNNKLFQLASKDYPKAQITNKGKASYVLVSNSEPYELESQWTGRDKSDYALVNVETGTTQNIFTNIPETARLSPNGKYVYGYNAIDSTWYTYAINSKKLTHLTKGRVFYNELNDYPNFPYSYGSAGWTMNDESILIYDRYDIWEFNPETGASKNLTNGRANKTVYRYLKLNKDLDYIGSFETWMLSTFNEDTKNSGFASLKKRSGKVKQLIDGPYRYSRFKKAQKASQITFTKESFKIFPDILTSDLNFKTITKLSDANPQQDDYNWGTAELVSWTSLDGITLKGMLIKPENFNPNKKYPLLVNFYEKSSDRLHRHNAPSYGRSTINYSFYTSRGYVIFNPDVQYRVGYPGESAFNCVIPGITSLIEKGFIDKDKIGVQGHSWGGYQIAYLVTKTDIFKAAESGAPVPNMISAYGGIRWWSGLSRQFQYEHTQSRIGGTPWQYPQRYIENSPIFNIDKINTPLLIMHNDADGHVPWYQGIEFFVSLRRLGKPSWFLNYNEEPHWPLKLQNRKDFNIRMAQFFDYYLKDAPMPVWMKRGVPALEKGVNQGLELIEKQ